MKSMRRLMSRASLPIALGAIVVLASLIVIRAPMPDPGVHLAYQDGQVVVASVDYGSAAQSTDLRPGAVVTWLNDQYVLGMSDRSKRDIAQSTISVETTTMTTTTRDQVPAEEAAFATLVKVARQSGTPWLSNPETNPVPECYLYGSCLYTAFGTYNFTSFDGNELCIPTDGKRLADIPSGSMVLPGGRIRSRRWPNTERRSAFWPQADQSATLPTVMSALGISSLARPCGYRPRRVRVRHGWAWRSCRSAG